MPSAFHAMTAQDIRERLPRERVKAEAAARFVKKLERRLAHLDGLATEPFVPQRGSITASCGHRVEDNEIECLTLDEGGGAMSSGCYCVWCSIKHKTSGALIADPLKEGE